MELIRSYLNSYKGLAKEIWIFALVILINRSGLMVSTYLPVYLHTQMGYGIAESGSIMIYYGVGSLMGVLFGGVIAERIGYLRTQFAALVISGIFILCMQFATEYLHFAFLLTLMVFFADMYRPANLASITQFSKFENRTRSLALVRLAINLGISIGPAIGGLLIATTGYKILFFVDGLTCIIAGIILVVFLGFKDKEGIVETKKEDQKPKRRNKKSFIYLLAANLLWASAFFQIIYTYPLFMESELNISEFIIGLTFTLNGLLIFFLEMPIVKLYEGNRKKKILYAGSVICAISFLFLYLAEPFALSIPQIIVWPIAYMIFITVGEIFYLPFTGSLAMNIAPRKKAAYFMSLYSMVFSISHILSPILGPFIADEYGFKSLWIICALIMLGSIIFISQLNEDHA